MLWCENVIIPECADVRIDEATDLYRDFVLEQIEIARGSSRDSTNDHWLFSGYVKGGDKP